MISNSAEKRYYDKSKTHKHIYRFVLRKKVKGHIGLQTGAVLIFTIVSPNKQGRHTTKLARGKSNG